MATNPKAPKVAPLLAPEVTSEVGGPEIVYLSEAAKRIVFTINPKATKYIVRDDGQIQEQL